MKKASKIIFILLMVIFAGCYKEQPREEQYLISTHLEGSTVYEGTSEIDYKKFFSITKKDSTEIEILDTMIDATKVDLSKPGSYQVKIIFGKYEKEITLTVLPQPLTYVIIINEEISTIIEVNSGKIDYKVYFKIVDSNGNVITVTDDMIDATKVDLKNIGSYPLKITFQEMVETVFLEVFEKEIPLTYTITVNEEISTIIEANNESVDYKLYFKIVDSGGNVIIVTDSMIDATKVDLTRAGEYSLKITYQGVTKALVLKVFEKEVIYTDFSLVFEMIKNLTLNKSGTATSVTPIQVRGTIYMDVKNETKLTYITDGQYLIKLYGDKIHNYTTPGMVYDVICYYKVNIFQPTLEVKNPKIDVINNKTVTPVLEIPVKEVPLKEILSLKRENLKENIERGYWGSMLKITGYLQYRTYNSKDREDFALTPKETFTKNTAGHIDGGLFFKNDGYDTQDEMFNYHIVVPGGKNIEITVFGVLYDYETNLHNWRIYVDVSKTLKYLYQE